MSEPVETALRLAGCGIKVVPCVGKMGVRSWPSRATTNPEQIREWFAGRYSDFNLGAVPGDSFLVVDNDSKKDGPANWLRLSEGEQTPNTLEIVTPTGGGHIWYRIDPSVVVNTGYDFFPGFPGVDIWSGSHILITPPSIHPEVGTNYRFVGEPLWNDPDLIADAPTWLLEKVAQPVARVREGRHPKLVAHAIKLRADGGLEADEIVMCLRIFQASLGFAKTDRELLGIARWAISKIPFDPARISEHEAELQAEGQAIRAGLMATFQNFISDPADTGKKEY
jgi:hypothetical protein